MQTAQHTATAYPPAFPEAPAADPSPQYPRAEVQASAKYPDPAFPSAQASVYSAPAVPPPYAAGPSAPAAPFTTPAVPAVSLPPPVAPQQPTFPPEPVGGGAVPVVASTAVPDTRGAVGPAPDGYPDGKSPDVTAVGPKGEHEDGSQENDTRGFKGGFSSRVKRFIGREIMRMICGGGGGKHRRRRNSHDYDSYGGGYGGYGGGGYGGFGCAAYYALLEFPSKDSAIVYF